jgi:hypothetical protein
LRLLLRRFPARTWEEPRAVNDKICQNHYEAVRQLGLVANQDQEAEICLQDAIDLNGPPSDIRFILAQMVCHGASRKVLEARFWDHLADEGDTVDSLRRKIDLPLYPDAFIFCNLQNDD